LTFILFEFCFNEQQQQQQQQQQQLFENNNMTIKVAAGANAHRCL
jgi:hypothetical protein